MLLLIVGLVFGFVWLVVVGLLLCCGVVVVVFCFVACGGCLVFVVCFCLGLVCGLGFIVVWGLIVSVCLFVWFRFWVDLMFGEWVWCLGWGWFVWVCVVLLCRWWDSLCSLMFCGITRCVGCLGLGLFGFGWVLGLCLGVTLVCFIDLFNV